MSGSIGAKRGYVVVSLAIMLGLFVAVPVGWSDEFNPDVNRDGIVNYLDLFYMVGHNLWHAMEVEPSQVAPMGTSLLQDRDSVELLAEKDPLVDDLGLRLQQPMNLIENGGAETGSFSGWTRVVVTGQNDMPAINPSTHYPNPPNYAGNFRFGFSVGYTPTEALQYQQLSVVAGQSYDVRLWYAIGQTESAVPRMRVEWINGTYPGASTVLYTETITSGERGWTQLTGQSFTPTGNTATLIIRYDNTGNATGISSVHVDEIEVIGEPLYTRTPTPTPTLTPTACAFVGTNLLHNPSFESGSEDNPDNWDLIDAQGASGNAIFWRRQGLGAQSGDYDLRFVGQGLDQPFDGTAVQRVEGLLMTKTYQLDGYVYGSNNTSTQYWVRAGFDPTGQVIAPNATTIQWVDLLVDGSPDSWRQFSVFNLAPMTTVMSVWLRGGTTMHTPGTFFAFDNLLLTETVCGPTPTPTEPPPPTATPTVDPNQPRLYFEPTGGSFGTGSFQVLVKFDANGNSAARMVFGFLNYDPSFVSFTGGTINTGTFDNAGYTNPNVNEFTAGQLAFSAASTGALGEGETVATLNFNASHTGAWGMTWSLVNPRESEVADASFDPIAAQFADAAYTITDAPIPTNTPTQPPAEPTPTSTVDASMPAVRVDPETATFSTLGGGEFQVELKLDTNGNTDVRMVFGFLHYDQTNASYLSGSINTAEFDNAGYTNPEVNEHQPGVLSFTAASLNAMANDTLIATLNFRADNPGSMSLVWLNDNPRITEVANASFDPIPAQMFGAVFNLTDQEIGTPTPVPSPTATPTYDPAMPALRVDPDGGVLGPVGGTFEVTLKLDTNGDTNARMVFGFLEYDQTNVSYVSGSINTDVFDNAGYTNPDVNEHQPGVLSFTAASLNAMDNDTLIATLIFEADSEGPMCLDWLVDNPRITELADASFDPIPVQMFGACFDIGTPGEDTPTPVPTDTPVVVPTDTPEPQPTDTPGPEPTVVTQPWRAQEMLTFIRFWQTPVAVDPTPVPTDTPAALPTVTVTPTVDPVEETPTPLPTNTPVVVPTNTPMPSEPVLRFDPASGEMPEGQFTVEIRLDSNGNTDLRMTFGFINYDTGKLNYIGGTIDTTNFDNAGYTNPTVNEHEPGILSFTAASLDALGNDVRVATLTFESVAGGVANLVWMTTDPRITELADAAFNPIAGDFQDAALTIPGPVMPVLRFVPDSGEIAEGAFTVEIRLDSGGNTDLRMAFGFINYDTAKLNYLGGTIDTTNFDNAGYTNPNVNEHEPGILSFTAASLDVLGDNVRLATLNFETVSGGTANLVWLTQDPRITELADASFNPIAGDFRNAALDIQGPVATDPVLRLNPASGTLPSSGSFSINIVLDANGNPDARMVFGFLNYNTNVATFVDGMVNTTDFDNAGYTNPNVNQFVAGQLALSAASTGVLGNDVVVATLNFNAIAAGTLNLTWSTTAPRETEVADASFDPIYAIFQNGSYTLGDAPTATPTPVVVNTPTPTSDPGDQPAIGMDPPSGSTVGPGTFTVDLKFSDNGESSARMVFGFVGYDTTYLSFTEGTINTATFDNAGFTNPVVSEHQPGVLSFTAASLGEIGNDATIATLTFQTVASGQATLRWLTENPTVTEVADASFDPLPSVQNDATYTVNH